MLSGITPQEHRNGLNKMCYQEHPASPSAATTSMKYPLRVFPHSKRSNVGKGNNRRGMADVTRVTNQHSTQQLHAAESLRT
jgi:hypothetical protein